jgi:prepilin-type N-terminal cleavage/methylation domain-containing protein
MLRKKIRKSQGGFTLIEIIAVLVILGILAAVAIPRFVDLQSQAREKAVQGALAAGGSNASMVFAQLTLQNSAAPSIPALVTALNAVDYTTVGDFTVSYAADGTKGVTVTVSAWTGGTLPSTGLTKNFTLLP